MRGTVLYGPGDIRFEDRETPKLSNRRMPSSASRPHACADRTSGRIAGSSRSRARRRWGTSTAASSKRSAAR